MAENLHISINNSKLGTAIPSVNLPAGVTCRQDAPCMKTCYALKGRFRFGNVKETMFRNLRIWLEAPEQYEQEIIKSAMLHTFFRWHSSGDIIDMSYLKMMIRVAETCAATRFLCFTKKFELVNEFIDNGGTIPENLIIVYSAWANELMPENPHDLPIAYVRLKNIECIIPDNAHECSKYCGDCVSTNNSCWKLHHGESVVFNQH